MAVLVRCEPSGIITIESPGANSARLCTIGETKFNQLFIGMYSPNGTRWIFR